LSVLRLTLSKNVSDFFQVRLPLYFGNPIIGVY
jgi:hypothetical protein